LPIAVDVGITQKGQRSYHNWWH